MEKISLVTFKPMNRVKLSLEPERSDDQTVRDQIGQSKRPEPHYVVTVMQSSQGQILTTDLHFEK